MVDCEGGQELLLEVKDLGFSYSDHSVLESIGFDVRPGETIALLGPNGVGKSTLFRCILGFLDSYRGSILLGGDDIRSLNPRETARRIAYIPQVSSPVFDFTVMELVLMGLASQLPLLESPDAADERRALEVLEEVGIGHLAYCPSGQISGGEYQLALMARALLQQAQVLVMDEPTANLDYGNQFRVMERMACLAAEGYSVVFSAHDPNQVLMHASRVLVLQAGRLVADGKPREVMTPELLSLLYGVNVKRVDVASDSPGDRSVSLCYPCSGAVGA